MRRVIVDTTVFSLAVRRSAQTDSPMTQELASLIRTSAVIMLGPIRLELLSGIKDETKFNALRERLRFFTDFPITTKDYETAAQFHNICRRHGIQGSPTDFIICAVAVNNDFDIMTTDNDFTLFSKHIPIQLRKTS